MKNIFFFLFIICSIFCVSCRTSQQLLTDRGGADDIRKNFGRIDGMQQSIKNTTELLKNYNNELGAGLEGQGSIIERLTSLIRRIRERNNKDGTQEDKTD